MQLERFGFRAMGSPCELQLWGSSRDALRPLASECLQEVLRLERKYSRYREESLASCIARSAGDARGLEVDEETAALLDFAETAYRESGGRFDPTSGVLRRAWDFKSGRLPDPTRLESVRALVGWKKLRWERPRLVLPLEGMELDFGGFVKEYAADRVAELCRSRCLSSGMVDLGGDLAVVGPHPDGSPWRVGIRNPRRPESAIARVALFGGALASSGDYERFMIVEGERYSHLLDPRSGWSFRGGPSAVSVVAGHCLIAGVTSTIAMLHSEKASLGFLERVGLPHFVVDQSGCVAGTANAVGDAKGGERIESDTGVQAAAAAQRLRSASAAR